MDLQTQLSFWTQKLSLKKNGNTIKLGRRILIGVVPMESGQE